MRGSARGASEEHGAFRIGRPYRTKLPAAPSESRRQRLTRRVLNRLVLQSWDKVRSLGAIAPGTAAAERFGSFGAGSLIAFPASVLFGEASIHLGRDTLVAGWATLSAGYSPDQPDVPDSALVVGDRCVIGLRSGIVAHESIVIGDDVWFGQDVYVTDSNHAFDDPHVPIGHQLGAHQPVAIGSGSWIGHGAVVLPGTRIGRQVVVAAGSVVRGDVHDHSVVGGVPARTLRSTSGPDLDPEDLAELLTVDGKRLPSTDTRS